MTTIALFADWLSVTSTMNVIFKQCVSRMWYNTICLYIHIFKGNNLPGCLRLYLINVDYWRRYLTITTVLTVHMYHDTLQK